MGNKRRPDSPLKSEPSLKIRRISTALDQGQAQDSCVAHSPPLHKDFDFFEEGSTTCSVPAPLTKKNLRLLESMTGSRPTPSATSGGSSAKTGTISTTKPDFEAKFRDNHWHDPLESRKKKLANQDEYDGHLHQLRGSASPTSSEDDRFYRGLARAANERDLEALYSGRILQDTNKVPKLEDMDYGANLDKQWVAFPPDVGFNNGLSTPKPDLVEGYARRAWPPTVNQLGGSATLVKNDPGFAALPHFAGEFKAFGKSMREGEVQAGYDGAAMVYARRQALAAIGQSDPPGRASPVTMSSDGRTWRLYAHSAEENKDTKELEYYQHQIASGDMTDSKEMHRGRKILRNAQDWGRKESTDLRDRMKKHYEANGHQLVGIANKATTSTKSASVASIKNAPASSSGKGKGPAPPYAPSSRSSDVASSQSSSSATKKAAASRPPPSASSSGSSNRDGKHKAQPDDRAMAPPPSRSLPSKRDDGQRLSTATKGSSRPSSSVSSVSRSNTPRSSNASVASSDRDRARGQPSSYQGTARPRDRDGDSYRAYRYRQSDEEFAPVQRRRSDSPQDKARVPQS